MVGPKPDWEEADQIPQRGAEGCLKGCKKIGSTYSNHLETKSISPIELKINLS